MKQKTSITLSSDVLREIDKTAGKNSSRSEFIENVLRQYFQRRIREAIHARDLELINANVDLLTQQARELDEYQAPIDWEKAEHDEAR